MSEATSVWTRLEEQIRKGRVSPAHSRTEVQNTLVRRVKALAGQRRCSAMAVGWFESRSIQQGRNQLLAHLQDEALLTICIDMDERRREIVSYSVALHGALSVGGTTWYARIDLDERSRGQGPCAHALLHAHLGVGEEGKFSPRAPLPWLHPADALDWLLATVEPAMEPPFPTPES